MRYVEARGALNVTDTSAVKTTLALADTALAKADTVATDAVIASSSTVIALANRDTLDTAKDTVQKATEALVPSLGEKIVTASKWALVGGAIVAVFVVVFHR